MPTIIPIPAFSDNYMDKLAALPGETRLYCGHKYTVADLRFALAVEPGNLIPASLCHDHAGLMQRFLSLTGEV